MKRECYEGRKEGERTKKSRENMGQTRFKGFTRKAEMNNERRKHGGMKRRREERKTQGE